MTDWNEINRMLSPIKYFEELIQRLQESFTYPFVRDTFNVSLPVLIRYTQLGLGGDPRGRYNDYAEKLVATFTKLIAAGVADPLGLMLQAETRISLETFASQSGIPARNIASALKYLVFWFVPMKKYLSGLVRTDPQVQQELAALSGLGIRTNLDLLQRGIHLEGRAELARSSGLPAEIILQWVHRADLSRMPWASKATIANIMGAGYGSLAQLADADPQQLVEDFYRYGRSIGKNLKHGNEIESSQRIARLLPPLVEQD